MKKERVTRNELFVFYLVPFLWFLYTIAWHFGVQANRMPQARMFGWFFKYLTFCGFVFQTVTLFICILAHLFPEKRALKRAADDFSCTTFCIANAITVMHWTLYFTTSSPVEGGPEAKVKSTVARSLDITGPSPLWVNLTVHLANALFAWADVLLAERTFRRRSLHQTFMFCALYILWIQLCATKNKTYPYPFLNKLPQPEGFVVTAGVAVTVVYGFYRMGSALPSVQTSQRLARLKVL